MAHQRTLRQPAPEYDRRNYNQATASTAPPSQATSASRSVTPATVSCPPAAMYGGHENFREEDRTFDRTKHGLGPDDVYLFTHDEHEYIAPEETNYSARACKPAVSHFQEAPIALCACGPRCPCKPACDFSIHSCPCQTYGGQQNGPPTRSFDSARTEVNQSSFNGRIRQQDASSRDRPVPDRSVANATPVRQDLQRSKTPRPNDCDGGAVSAEPLQARRQRAPTVNNDLVYVPPAPKKTPSRKQKDPIPLGFYGTHGSLSGQRYPKFNIGTASSQKGMPSPPVFAPAPGSSERDRVSEHVARTLAQLSAPHSAFPDEAADLATRTSLDYSMTMFGSDEVEPCTRTPSPLSAPRQRRQQCNKTYAAITGEDVESYEDSDEHPTSANSEVVEDPARSSGKVTYPAIPRSTSAGLFSAGNYTSNVTQSFPTAQMGNPRDPEPILDQPRDPRDEWYDHGYNIRTNANDSVPTRHSSPASGSGGFAPPLPPPLPLPDFIAPRPATKQRYVSAGGTAKLEDRPEITGFVLPPRVTPGITMPRELLLQHLESTPQFATPPRSITIGSPMLVRGSEEVMDSSTRSSYEDGPDLQSTRRDRKESGSSQRLARFKRVFSFNKEDKESSPS